jgi:iron complex outermembrane receptor protein
MSSVSTWLAGGAAASALVICAAPVWAQGAGGPPAVLEEVIVTAERREQSLQDAPLSILAFNDDSLAQIGATGLGDLALSIPNLTQITFSVGNSTLRFYVRGIGQTDSQLTGDSPVGVYLDGVYIARTSGLALSIPDIERVEVLRGPQGTLFGRNTTGGAISIVTKTPQTDQFGFTQKLRLGDYDALKSSTVINLPVSDEFAARVSYLYDRRDGTVENTGIGNDFNEWENKALRLSARWRPTEALTLDYSFDDSRYVTTADYLQIEEVSALFAGVIPEQTRRVSSASLPNLVRDSHTEGSGHALTATLDTGIGQFKSISAYRELDYDAYQDQSGNPTIAVFRNELLVDSQHQFSQELQLVGETEKAALSYVLGLYYFRESGEEVANDEISLVNLDLPRHLTATNTAYAAYTSWTWRPGGVSPWAFTLGGRYSEDEREANNFVVPPVSASYGKFTPSAVVDYSLSETSSVYGRIATGYNAGGYNMRAADFSQDFGPESLISYEAGWKTELLDRRLRFNGAVFFSDYTDIQFTVQVPNQPNPAFTQTLNAGTEHIYGLELDATYLFTDRLIGSLTYGHLDGEFKKGAPGDDVSLYRLANAPDHSLRATLDWTMRELFGGELGLFLDYAWQDETNTTPRDPSPGSDLIESHGVFDAQLRWDRDAIGGGRSGVSVALWMKNALDEEYFVDSASVFQGLHANRLVRYGDPRTYGVEFEYRF